MSNPIIHNRLELLTPEYRSFVLGEYSRITAQTFGESLEFDETRITILENGIALFLLLFLSKEKFIEFVVKECEISIEESVLLVTAITKTMPETFLEELAVLQGKLSNIDPDNLEKSVIPNTTENTLYEANAPASIIEPKTVPVPPKSEQTQPVVPVSNSEPEPVVQPLRTMEGDMERIHGYGAYRKMYPLAEDGQVVASVPERPQPTVEPIHTSTQEEMLEERPTLAKVPSYDDAPKTQSDVKNELQPPTPPANLPTE